MSRSVMIALPEGITRGSITPMTRKLVSPTRTYCPIRFQNPIGQYVRVGDTNFRVIGVMEPRVIPSGKAIITLRDMNEDVYIPITVAREDFQSYSEHTSSTTSH